MLHLAISYNLQCYSLQCCYRHGSMLFSIFWLQSFECGSHSTLTAGTMMLRKCIIIEKKVIKFWNALALHYIIYRNHSFTAGKTRLLAFVVSICTKFEEKLSKYETNENTVAGRNRIFPPLSI